MNPPTGGVGFAFFFIAYALAVGGLLASTFHLGHPERAWRAFSQWKTSWLSREGVLAVAALLTVLVLLVRRIDQRVVAVRDSLNFAAANTADTANTTSTAYTP